MRSYMECDGKLYEIGEGFTEFTENKNPREYSRQYINETVERTDIVGFASSVTYAFDVYENDKVQKTLLDMTCREAIGEDAVVTIVTAFLYKNTENAKCVEAIRRKYTVCPSKLGNGMDALICAGTLRAYGDMEYGELNTVTTEFHLSGVHAGQTV